jgi:hypothetical protein
MEGATLVGRLKKARAMDSVREIRAMFKASGITEAELQESGKAIRRDVVRSRYSAKS